MGNIQSYQFNNPAGPHSNPATRASQSASDFNKLTSDIEAECEKWQSIIKNIRLQNMPPQQKHEYIATVLNETMDKFKTHFPSSVMRNDDSSNGGSENVKGDARPAQVESGNLQKYKEDLAQLLKEKTNMQQEHARRVEENKHLQVDRDQLTNKTADLQKELSQAQKNMEKMQVELDDFKTRLSKLIGDRLRDNNPDIADLSDANRPTKLGEVYSELYDNEWTDAFDALVKSDHKEEHAIETLRLTLMNCWTFSKEMSAQMVQKIEKTLQELFGIVKVSHVEKFAMTTNLKAKAKETDQSIHMESLDERPKLEARWKRKKPSIEPPQSNHEMSLRRPLDLGSKLQKERKDIAASLVPFVQKAYMKTLLDPTGLLPEMKPFIKKCLFVTWMMAVQTPPMSLDCETISGKPFDGKCYREYMKKGSKVEFILWPAVRLHEQGPLIAKGVAQGMDG